MTRSGFANVAQMLGESFADANLAPAQQEIVINAVSTALRAENPRFDGVRFRDAVIACCTLGTRVPYASL